MRQLTLDQVAQYLEFAVIQQTHDVGHAFIHIGLNAMGGRFVMVNDAQGDTALTESM